MGSASTLSEAYRSLQKHKNKTRPLSINLFILSLLLSTNLLTFFISTRFHSPCSPCAATDTASVNISAHSTTPDDDSRTTVDLPPEFLAFTSPHTLPFGFNTNMDTDRFNPPVGRACTLYPDELRSYMSYKVNGSCPDDELLAQKLLLKGCEPLPRRRCHPAAPPEYVEPYPVPTSHWTTPSDKSVVWTAYTCKNYQCLIDRHKNQKGSDDCKDCFDLQHREKVRWITGWNTLDFTIDEVLAVKKPGTIRIGLDIGGGVATFAVRMKERNITIITTSMNLNGPFNNFIAARGVIPMYLGIAQRLPFFDNTLDIVHSMHVISNWIPTTLMQFMFYDIYRVLRPGGLFWLDHFFCVGDQLEDVYAPLINSIGFEKVKWEVGPKLDRGEELREMYISALLEKPLKNSW